MKGGNCFLFKVTKGTNFQSVQVCREPHSFKVIYEGNVVWFSRFPFMSSLEAVLSVYTVGIVSSRIWTSFPWMMTMSGLEVVGTNETGTVKGGFSEALRLGRSTYRVASEER